MEVNELSSDTESTHFQEIPPANQRGDVKEFNLTEDELICEGTPESQKKDLLKKVAEKVGFKLFCKK